MERRLGRGLDSLISRTSKAAGSAAGQLLEVPLEAVTANPDQPRTVFNEATLEGLAASIRSFGVLQPIVVQARESGYQLVAGERRLRASKLAGRVTIPAIVLEASGPRSLELALIENLQRENLGPLDEAAAYEALLEQTRCTHYELAERLGKSRAVVTNSLRLLDLPDEVKQLVQAGALSGAQARTILSIPDSEAQVRLALQTAHHGWTVRELEARAKLTAKKPGNKRKPQPASLKNTGFYEEQLRRFYGTRVRVHEVAGRGDVRFEFYSAKDRDRLLHALLAGPRPATEPDPDSRPPQS